MRVRIDKSVFSEARDDSSFLELNFLLHIILYKQRYSLSMSDGEILATDSFKKLTPSDQLIVQNTVSNGIVSSSNSADCEVVIGGEKEMKCRIFSPEEAIVFLMQPISIVLENGFNDSHFVRALFRLFDSSGLLSRYEREGWIQFENAGGCSNLVHFLQSRIGYYGEKEKFLRCFVLLDGDRRFPTDPEPEIKYRKLKTQLSSWKVGFHILEKRCMENYMPDEAMNSFTSKVNREWLMAYQSLSPIQKDFYCIAEGFQKDIDKESRRKIRERESRLKRRDLKRRKKSYVKSVLPAGVASLYSTVSDGNFLHLESGLNVGCFKTKFPMKFSSSTFVYKSNMLRRTSHQADPYELEHLISGIMKLL